MRTSAEMDQVLNDLRALTASSESAIRNKAARSLEICSALFEEIKLRRDGLIRKKHYENALPPGESGISISN